MKTLKAFNQDAKPKIGNIDRAESEHVHKVLSKHLNGIAGKWTNKRTTVHDMKVALWKNHSADQVNAAKAAIHKELHPVYGDRLKSIHYKQAGDHYHALPSFHVHLAPKA